MGTWNVIEFVMSKERRRDPRFGMPSIPVQLSDVDGELVDLSLRGAAVLHRSPVKAGTACTLIFPSYGGIYVPCQVLRSIVQVRRGSSRPEYIFRSAITFLPMSDTERGPLHEFLKVQIQRLKAVGE
ncbi:MAG: PilZ domain-containing protein [Thermoanaerobaculia bacterium]